MATDERSRYKHLDVYRQAHDLAVRVHAMSLKLPAFETREEGLRVRKCSKEISARIAEAWAVKREGAEFVRILRRALGSASETRERLQLLRDTRSLADADLFEELSLGYKSLVRRMDRFIEKVEKDAAREARSGN